MDTEHWFTLKNTPHPGIIFVNSEHSWSRIFHDQGVEVRLLSKYVEAVSKLLDRQKFWNRSRKQRLLKRPRETITNNA